MKVSWIFVLIVNFPIFLSVICLFFSLLANSWLLVLAHDLLYMFSLFILLFNHFSSEITFLLRLWVLFCHISYIHVRCLRFYFSFIWNLSNFNFFIRHILIRFPHSQRFIMNCVWKSWIMKNYLPRLSKKNQYNFPLVFTTESPFTIIWTKINNIAHFKYSDSLVSLLYMILRWP